MQSTRSIKKLKKSCQAKGCYNEQTNIFSIVMNESYFISYKWYIN